ncbi:MAG: DUF1682 domain-containing protein [Chlorobiales bacterium]|nr:DUF1682 domain-containing protein [Chlorobiales bacterium]
MNRKAIVIGLLSFFTAAHTLTAQPVNEPPMGDPLAEQDLVAMFSEADDMAAAELPPDEPPQFEQRQPRMQRPMQPVTEEERNARQQVMIDRMAERLSLTDKQKEKVSSVIKESSEQAQKEQEEASRERAKRLERMNQKRKETDEKILSLLDDKQKEEFKKMKTERMSDARGKRPDRRPPFDGQPQGCR